MVSARFAASEPASEALLCLTEPPPPSLFSRTGAFLFEGLNCSAVAELLAPCQVSAHWPTAWTPAPPSPWPSCPSAFLAGRQPQPPCCCSTPCVVLAAFSAADRASEVFDCSTLPSLPLLLMRTGEFVLLAPFWVESAVELASWPVYAFWPTAWTRSPHPQPPAWLWLTPCVVSARFPAADSAAEVLDCFTAPL